MNEGGRRRSPGLAALLLLAGATLAAGALVARGRPPDDRPVVARLAPPLLARARAALEGLTRPQEVAAVEAARVPEIGAGFANQVDAATFQDLFETEEGWRPYREKGKVSALFDEHGALASLFTERPLPRADSLVAAARSKGVTSGLVKGDGRVYLVGAARVDKPEKAAAAHAVVLVGQMLDVAALTVAARQIGSALALTSGDRVLVSGGPPDADGLLADLVGREEAAPLLTGDRLLAAATPLAPGLWLWTVGNDAVPVPRGRLPLALGGVAALMCLAGLALAVGRRPSSGGTGSGQQPDIDRTTPPVPRSPRAMAASDRPTDPAVDSAAAAADRRHRATLPRRSGLPSAATATAQPAQPTPKVDTGSDLQKRYTLLDKIGEGGMAEVFRATLHGAAGFERQLVVKRLHAALSQDNQVVSQFIDEARLQSELSHANIVPVLDFGRAGQDYFLVLEYIRGRDLDKVEQRFRARFGRSLDQPIAAYIMGEVLSALEYAHEKTDADGRALDIVHRDVSKGNVLISYHGEVKLSDFGIVKAERRVAQTEVGVIKGNAAFMAPEQARGEPVDLRADLFSVGAVLYWCLSGQPLYAGEAGINQLLRAAVGPATAQHLNIDGFGAEIAPILARALAPDPDKRFASAAELARALKPLAGTTTRQDIARLMRTLFAEEMQRER
ncbi:MAG TPA: serine/threonine-protein kinase [Polyangia bacterium]|nr:serine/threonine-protein kinase [Polyangia bacterium]